MRNYKFPDIASFLSFSVIIVVFVVLSIGDNDTNELARYILMGGILFLIILQGQRLIRIARANAHDKKFVWGAVIITILSIVVTYFLTLLSYRVGPLF